MAQADEGILKSIYGKNAEMMRNRCLGLDASPVQTEDEVKSVSNELTFSTDLTERIEIEQAVTMLSAKVARRLRRGGLAGYTIGLKVRYADLSFANVQHTLDHAVDDEQVFAPVLQSLIAQVWQPGQRLRLVGVSVSSFDARPNQLSLFGEDAFVVDKAVVPKPHSRSLIEATDKVKDRFGERSLGYGRELRFRDRDTGTIAQKKDE
jgi:DNA polymerase-4